jgi:NAD(P)-dependent dehydrogenase (short-subunit alcohol dehydrogenase family)
MAMKTLDGKTVVVIGGTSGIGYAVAEAAQAAGARVVVGSKDTAKVKAAVDRLGANASGWAVDVSDEADVSAFFERAGAFDHLAFTAGDWAPILAPRPMADLDLADATAVFAVRFWGAITAIKHAMRTIAPDGSITLTSGVISRRPYKGAPLNTAMAGAVEHLAVGLAVDLGPVRVNVVSPGFILTDVWKDAPMAEMTKQQPVPRGGERSEAAQAYLSAMLGGFMTGQVLVVDGGSTLV